MITNRHAQMNSLVGQIQVDAESIRRTAAAATAFSPDQLKLMADAAHAILNKVANYTKLNAAPDGDGGVDK